MRDLEVRYVEWGDSSSLSGWGPLKEARELRPDSCASVGFVLGENDEYLTLLQSFTNRSDPDNDHGDHVLTIPKFAITKALTLHQVEAA